MNKQKGKNLIHGHTANGKKSKAYAAWITMKANCYDEFSSNYHLHGAKGIRVCIIWRADFPRFLADMGEPTDKCQQLCRKDVNADYSPKNCYWGYRSDRLTYQGQTKTIGEWAKDCGLSKNTFQARIYKYGWSIEKALSTPLDTRRWR